MARAKSSPARDKRAAPAAAIGPAPAPARSSWPFALPGSLLIAGGAAARVSPYALLRVEARALFESASYLPLLAVAMVFCGIALSILGLQRQGSSEPPFALERPKLDILAELNPKRFFYDTWRELDAEAARERAARGEAGYDWRPLVVFSAGAVCLGLMEYLGHGTPPANAVTSLRQFLDTMAPPDAPGPQDGLWYTIRYSPFRGLTDFVWWSGWRVLGFFLLPALVVKLVLRERLAD